MKEQENTPEYWMNASHEEVQKYLQENTEDMAEYEAKKKALIDKIRKKASDQEFTILNTFMSDAIDQKYYTVKSPVYQNGDYRIFKQSDSRCFLYTYKNIAFAQLTGVNTELVDALAQFVEPLSTPTWTYKRALENLRKGLKLMDGINQNKNI